MLDITNLFPTATALETLSEWTNLLKSFQHRLGSYFARSEARQAAFNYIQALLSPVEEKMGGRLQSKSVMPILIGATFIRTCPLGCKCSHSRNSAIRYRILERSI